MAKVSPQPQAASLMRVASRREVYTIWMKSLVLEGNGCTVYDSEGRIVCRVDNYNNKGSDEVYVMDHSGKALFKIVRKNFRVFGRWEAYRFQGSDEEVNPWFTVRKACRVLKREQNCKAKVTVGCGSDNPTFYEVEGTSTRSSYRIMDISRGLVAEVKAKLTASGVALGDDVLMLVLEPNLDRLLIIGLVVVCGLINHMM